MRADRLLAELTLLQARGRMTATELATELEVTERTVYRDMYALQVAGVPLVADRGRDGGYSLYGDWRADLTGLTTAELESLLVAAASSPEARSGSRATTAAAKLAAMLPAEAAGELSRLRSRIHVVLDSEDGEPSVGKTAATLVDSLRRGLAVDLTLRRLRSPWSRRRVHPIGLVIHGRDWYLVWHGGDGRPRIDGLDAVVDAKVADEGALGAPSIDLETVWRRWIEARGGSANRYQVLVRMERDLLPFWRDRYTVVKITDVPTGIEVATTFNSTIEARTAVLPWGGAIEVIAPQALRLSVADFAGQAAAVYADG
ncbi:MAG: WYL domain-containing protein [bacterium]|nr:WYL domain-containing protein [bacterium]